MSKSHSAILKDLKAKKYAPVYFLQSDEAYFIDEIVKHIENEVLTEGEKSFNQVVLYGKETDAKQVMDQAMQYPMMASHRVVIVKEAQEMSSLDKLSGYVQQPSEQTLLVLAHKHKKLDKRKKLWKALGAKSTILESKRIYENQYPPIVLDIAKEKGLNLDARIAHQVIQNLGTNLSKISNEFEKLALNLKEGTAVTMDHVETYMGISKDYNVFELQKAISAKDKYKAYQIVQYFSRNKKAHPIQRNIGALYSYLVKVFMAKKFQNADNKTFAAKLKVSPFFTADYKQAAKNYSLDQLKAAFGRLHLMDKKCKGIGVRTSQDLALYQEFLYGLMK